MNGLSIEQLESLGEALLDFNFVAAQRSLAKPIKSN
ncbi:DUF4351 domain-containing protein [Calothrix sp. CCY 0018]